MEETHKIRDKRSLQHLYDKTLPVLANSIHSGLTDIIPLFHEFLLERVVNTWTKPADAGDDTPISIENGNVQQMGLRLRLEGFKHAVVPPFDVSKELLFTLRRTGYEVGPNKNEVWEEKLYYEPWTEAETKNIAQRWCNELIDEITKRLEGMM